MPAECKICVDPRRAQIEDCYAIGLSDAAIAARFQMARSGCRRHRVNHYEALPANTATELESNGADLSVDERIDAIAARLRREEQDVEAIAVAAEKGRKFSVALQARNLLRQLRDSGLGATRMIGELRGELGPKGGTSVVINLAPDVETAIAEERGRMLAALAAEGVPRLTVAAVARRLSAPPPTIVDAIAETVEPAAIGLLNRSDGSD
jgi:hypothetical protein